MRYFLAWFLPMMIYVVLSFGIPFRPRLMNNIFFSVFFVCLMMVANLGAFVDAIPSGSL